MRCATVIRTDISISCHKSSCSSRLLPVAAPARAAGVPGRRIGVRTFLPLLHPKPCAPAWRRMRAMPGSCPICGWPSSGRTTNGGWRSIRVCPSRAICRRGSSHTWPIRPVPNTPAPNKPGLSRLAPRHPGERGPVRRPPIRGCITRRHPRRRPLRRRLRLRCPATPAPGPNTATARRDRVRSGWKLSPGRKGLVDRRLPQRRLLLRHHPLLPPPPRHRLQCHRQRRHDLPSRARTGRRNGVRPGRRTRRRCSSWNRLRARRAGGT
jgi:hypothetical protein